jgi:hypothetical protein
MTSLRNCRPEALRLEGTCDAIETRIQSLAPPETQDEPFYEQEMVIETTDTLQGGVLGLRARAAFNMLVEDIGKS